MIGYYSFTPDEQNKLENQVKISGLNRDSQTETGLYTFPIMVYQQIRGGGYILIQAKIYFEGKWQPTTFMINLNNNLIFSRGPVDFRGILI